MFAVLQSDEGFDQYVIRIYSFVLHILKKNNNLEEIFIIFS